MAMQALKVIVSGVDPLITNNPQTVDPMNKYTLDCAELYKAAKKANTPEMWQASREMDVRSKIFWDDKIGIYVPSMWVREAIATAAFKLVKKGKDAIRGAVFPVAHKCVLDYAGKSKIKTPLDIVKNPDFINLNNMPQGQIRIVKAEPIFHDWSFTCDLEYDDSVITSREIKTILEHTAKYVGFGDHRPTFGRATVEFA